MKKNRFVRLLSVLLTLCMLITCMPISNVIAQYKTESSLSDDKSNDKIDQEQSLMNVNELPTDTCKILNYVDNIEFKAKEYAFRVPEEENLNTYVFQSADGTRTVYYFDENVKYVNEDGDTVEKDISLVSSKQGYGIVKSNINLNIPNNPNNGISMSYSGYTIMLSPIGAKSETTAAKKDNAIVYSNAFGNNISLKYTPILSGLKEDIILSSYMKDASFSFSLDTGGLYLFNDKSGYYLADSIKSTRIFNLGDIIVYDATGKPCMGSMTVKTIETGKKYILTISADDKFLSDPTTVYPVTIDPTLTISDNSSGVNSIQDAPIFSGLPTNNFGSYQYNRMGSPGGNYGIGRTVVRLYGLYTNSIYQTINANQITSVKFYAKEASGGGQEYINLYPIIGNSSWTEANVTWTNIGAHSTAVNCGANMGNSQITGFDITALVKGWKNNTYSAEAGFIMTNIDETGHNKSFYSSEYTTTTDRPYVVMTYIPHIALSHAEANVLEGGDTITIIAVTRPTGLPVSWSSSNESVATVNNGVITGLKAGKVTITATITDTAGVSYSAICIVYIRIENGIYYFKNQYSGKCMHAENNGFVEHTNISQYTQSFTPTLLQTLSQLWRVNYLGKGLYSIRPYHKLNLGVTLYTTNNAGLTDIGTTDSLSGVFHWSQFTINNIGTESDYYKIRFRREDNYVLALETASSANNINIHAEANSTSLKQNWILLKINSPIPDISIYNTETNLLATPMHLYITPNETKTLESLSLAVAPHSFSTIDQTVTWESTDTSVATINSTTGAITGVSPGHTTILARKYIDGVNRAAIYTLTVTELQNGVYFLKNKQSGMFADIYHQTMANGTRIHQWNFHAGNTQRWTFTHLGDEYYSIKSANSTADYYLGVINDSTGLNVDIVLRTGALTDGMKWKIEPTSDGGYKLIPKTGEANGYVLATTSSDPTNGDKLIQGDYVVNNSYRDEWQVLYVEPDYTNVYIGAYDGDPLMPDIINSVKNEYTRNEYYGNGSTKVSKDEFEYFLKNTTVYSVITHGNQTSIRLTNDSSYAISDMNRLSSSELSNLIFVYYGACYTGKGGAGATNLVNTTFNKGVDVVLGFMVGVLIDETNFWSEIFMSEIASGSSIGEAIITADLEISTEPGLLGRDSYTIHERLIRGSLNTVPCP